MTPLGLGARGIDEQVRNRSTLGVEEPEIPESAFRNRHVTAPRHAKRLRAG
jgi:hypothetical protein